MCNEDIDMVDNAIYGDNADVTDTRCSTEVQAEDGTSQKENESQIYKSNGDMHDEGPIDIIDKEKDYSYVYAHFPDEGRERPIELVKKTNLGNTKTDTLH